MTSAQLQISPLLFRCGYFLVDKERWLRWSHIESNACQRRENSEILAAIKLLSSDFAG